MFMVKMASSSEIKTTALSDVSLSTAGGITACSAAVEVFTLPAQAALGKGTGAQQFFNL